MARVLLDECVPKRLARSLLGHAVRTVPQLGWFSRRDQTLLARAQGEFDVIVTVDQNIQFQQRITPEMPMIVVLVARSNRFTDLLPLVPQVLKALDDVRPGIVVPVGE